MRTFIKHLLSVALYYSGSLYAWDLWRYRRSRHGRPVILMYHRVSSDFEEEASVAVPGMVVTTRSFVLQLEHLQRNCQLMSLTALADAIRQKRKPPFRTIVITFDDGWRDNFDNAFEPMHSRQVPATIFVSTGFVESNASLWFHLVPALMSRGLLTRDVCRTTFEKCGLGESPLASALVDSVETPDKFMVLLKQIPAPMLNKIVEHWQNRVAPTLPGVSGADCMLTWEQMRQMRDHGITIGSHTESHAILTLLADDELQRELRQSKRLLEERLGDPIVTMAYPNGDCNDRVKRATRAAGYEVACATAADGQEREAGDLFALPRTGIHEGACAGFTGRFSKAIFACLLSGLWQRRGPLRSTPGYGQN